MVSVLFQRVTSLPAITDPNTLYFVKPEGAASVNLYASGSDANPLPVATGATDIPGLVAQILALSQRVSFLEHEFVGSGGGTVIPPPVPSFTAQPAITGTPQVGSVAGLIPGTLTNGTIGTVRLLKDGADYADGSAGSFQWTAAGSYVLRVTIAGTSTYADSAAVAVVAAAAFQPVALYRTSAAGANPPTFSMTTGSAAIGVHSFRLRQSTDNFATTRTSETFPYTSDFDLSKEDDGGWNWPSLSTNAPGPWQAEMDTLDANGNVLATSNRISDTLGVAKGVTLISFAATNSKTATMAFAAGRNIVVSRDNGAPSALTVAGVAATFIGRNAGSGDGAPSTSYWDVTLPSGGQKTFTFTGNGAGDDARVWIVGLSQYGSVARTSLYMEANQNAYATGAIQLYSADNGAATVVPAGGIALHLMIQTSSDTPSPLNVTFIDNEGPGTFLLATGTNNGQPQGFSLPTATSNYGSRTYVVFNPAGA